jgi:hypothetical protein
VFDAKSKINYSNLINLHNIKLNYLVLIHK